MTGKKRSIFIVLITLTVTVLFLGMVMMIMDGFLTDDERWQTSERWLADNWDDRAGNEVDASAEGKRKDWLDVEGILNPIRFTDTKVHVVLEGETD